MEYLSDDNAAVGRRIRQIRRSAHMTQEKLADVLGVTVNYLGEVERGRKPLSRSLEDQFCLFFHVTYDYLYHGIPPISRHMIRERAAYDSIQTSLLEQLKSCSPEEILIISHLIGNYLDLSRHLQNQEIPQNHAGGNQYTAPEDRPPQFS